MFASGTSLFLLVPDESNRRILLPGKVLQISGQNVTAEFEKIFELPVGTDVVLYTEWRGKFYQQGARTIEMCQTESNVLAFECIGEPISAESRQIFRVSTALAGITGCVDDQNKCPIVDMSPEGFAAVARRELRVGSTVRATLGLESGEIEVMARVQTIKPLGAGKFRYGFLVAERKSPGRMALEKATASYQRMQLRRLSGAA